MDRYSFISAAAIVGIPLGCLIGIVTGIVTLLVLKDAFHRARGRLSWLERIFGRRQASGLKLSVRILTIPVFWGGGPWVTTAVMRHLDWLEITPSYLLSLVVVYAAIVIVPLVRLIIWVGNNFRGPAVSLQQLPKRGDS
jgi:hypothetical protein